MKNKIDLSNLINLQGLENLPSADIIEISESTCSIKGEYKITAPLDKNENLKSSYDDIGIRFSTPESSDIYTMTISGKNLVMIRQNKEKFYVSKIFIRKAINPG